MGLRVFSDVIPFDQLLFDLIALQVNRKVHSLKAVLQKSYIFLKYFGLKFSTSVGAKLLCHVVVHNEEGRLVPSVQQAPSEYAFLS